MDQEIAGPAVDRFDDQFRLLRPAGDDNWQEGVLTVYLLDKPGRLALDRIDIEKDQVVLARIDRL